MNKPIAYAAVATDASEAVYVTTDKEDAESMCRCEGWMLLPLHHLPVAWQEEAAAVDDAFQRSGVKRTWPDDEPDQIIPMVNAMADEIAHLRLTDKERKALKAILRALYATDYEEEYVTVLGLLERLK